MQQQNKAILQSSKAQLQNARDSIYTDSYNQKVAELNTQLEQYKLHEQVELNKAIEELKKAYDKAVSEKAQAFDTKITAMEQQIQVKAKAFAEMQIAETNKLIAQIDTLLGKE